MCVSLETRVEANLKYPPTEGKAWLGTAFSAHKPCMKRSDRGVFALETQGNLLIPFNVMFQLYCGPVRSRFWHGDAGVKPTLALVVYVNPRLFLDVSRRLRKHLSNSGQLLCEAHLIFFPPPNLPRNSIFSSIPALLGGVPDSMCVHVYMAEPHR